MQSKRETEDLALLNALQFLLLDGGPMTAVKTDAFKRAAIRCLALVSPPQVKHPPPPLSRSVLPIAPRAGARHTVNQLPKPQTAPLTDPPSELMSVSYNKPINRRRTPPQFRNFSFLVHGRWSRPLRQHPKVFPRHPGEGVETTRGSKVVLLFRWPLGDAPSVTHLPRDPPAQHGHRRVQP